MMKPFSICLAGLLAIWLLPAAYGDPLFPNASSVPDQLFAQGKFEAARQAYTAAMTAAPADPAVYAGQVRTLLRLDRWEEALLEAQSFASKFPDNADAHGLLALALIRAGWQEPYTVEAKKSLTLQADNYWGLIASGRAADWDGHEAEAGTLFRKASERHPEWPDAWLGLLGTLDDEKNAAEKTTVTAKYLALNPQGQPHDRAIEGLRDYQTSASAYRRAFDADPPFQQVKSKESSDAAEAATLKVDFVGDYAVFPVMVDGQRFRLLFDTGAGDLLLTSSAARRLKLPTLAHSFLRGVSGKQRTDVLKAGTMTLSGLQYRSVPIRILGFSPAGTDGILGGSALDDCVITLDYSAGTATLSPAKTAKAPPPLPGDQSIALPFRIYSDHLFVLLQVNGHPAWAMIDTGAELSFLSLRFAKSQVKGLSKEEYRTGSFRDRVGVGDTNRRIEYVYSRAQSSITLSAEPPVSVETDTVGQSTLDQEISPDYDFEISLLLGVSSLTYARRVTIDYPRHLLTFEYKDPDAAPKAKTK